MHTKIKKFFSTHYRTICFLLLIFCVSVLAIDLVNPGYDSYWHLSAGKYIVNNGVPHYDVFSWYGVLHHLPWTAHEWLSEVVFYFQHLLFGKYSGLFFCFCSYFTILFFLFMFHRKEYLKDLRVSVLYVFLSFFTLGSALTPRPHWFSYLLLVFALYLLYDFYKNSNSKKIYFYPFLSLLWANLHGGSSNLAYILLGIFFVSECLERKMTIRKGRKYFFLLVFVLITLSLNPYGPSIFWYPYLNMGDSFMKAMIVEWHAPDILNWKHFPVFLFFGIALYFLIKNWKRYRLIDHLLFFTFFGLALTSIRFVPLFYIVFGFSVCYPVNAVSLGYKTNYVLFWAALFLSICGLFKVPGAIESMKTPVLKEEVIECLKRESPERLFNYYDYGGYLINRGISVFVDGRADVYSSTILKDFYRLSYLLGSFEEILNTYQFDVFVIPSDLPLCNYLKEQNYLLIMTSDGVSIYRTRE